VDPFDGIGPVNRDTTAGIVAEQLRQAIIAGSLPPGTQMGETDLSRRLGVSRGPLREAMQRLVQEGLLRSERNRGLFVITLDSGEIHDIYHARMAVERAAVELIMNGDQAAAAAQLAAVQKKMAVAAKRGDADALSDADLEFHEVLVRASGSLRLQRMGRTLLVETRLCLAALQDKYSAPVLLVDEHESIVRAIRAGTIETVLTVLQEHMADAVRRLAPQSTEPVR
jgi:DNA-binding GntR family transcriptional regulator